MLFRDVVRKLKKDKLAMVSLGLILIYFLMAILAQLGWIFPNVSAVDNSNSYQPPTVDFWLGTDIFGKDVLAKCVYGTKTALFIGLVASLISVPIGVVLGALAGYFGGWVDDLITWLYTTVDSIPGILLIIGLAYALGPGITNAYIAIGVTSWVSICRVIRGEFLKHRSRDYILAAEALGAGHLRRIFLHILPNTFPIILIQFSLRFVFAIKSEVVLSYLGLGVESGQYSWGVMIDDAKQELFRGVWWGLAGATVFMFVIVLAFNLFNDALRDALDPKLKGK